MNLLKKTIGFTAVLCVIPAAFALTARPSVVGTVATRLPTMTAYINGGTIVSGTTTNSSSNLMDNIECIEAYTSCMSDADACGPNFEECTTKVLFHGKMPKCISTLAQCSAAGVNSLFGTSSTTALANVASTNSDGEITDYTYPTNGSVMGQMIAGAAISNMYDTSDCIRRYTTCLQRDNVCGADFELCTTNSEFKKQKVFCESTLARCQSEGKTELFGSTNTSGNPTSDSRIGIMISEGAALAAVNAVSTCYKVVDQCFYNACAASPYKCSEGMSGQNTALFDAIQSGTSITSLADLNVNTNAVSNSDIQGYIKNQCLDTIGANKYCYATFLGNGAMPTASQLSDMDNQEDIFAEAYSARMNSSMKSKINTLIEEFDADARASCVETISSCVMRTCGGGSGAACYSQVFGGTDKSINSSAVYDEIKNGCSAIVNTDPYCMYAAANTDGIGTYTYSYINQDVFTTLFPEYKDNGSDPIGVVASLNASLASSYNDASIAQMRTQCENVAKSCVKSMCGEEYSACYRNRTDIYSSLTNSESTSFNKSMNRVGGVLDYTIVLGLCLDTVKNATVCQEHLAIEQAKVTANMSNSTSSWGSATNVRGGWLDAGSSINITEDQVQTDIQETDIDGNKLCYASDRSKGICDTVTPDGDVYDEPAYISYTTYTQNRAAESLFSDVMYDLEKEAQAIYNSKLTQEQHACLSGNAGGIMAASDTGGTFMWSKLRSNRVPDDYGINGLARNDFVTSNDLYGSFCAVKVTLQSDDAKVQEAMKGADWSNAFFAVGDTFTCGSWIPADDLEDITDSVVADATADMVANQNRTTFWTTLLGTLGGAVGGAYLGSGIQKGTVFSGLTGFNNPNKTQSGTTASNITVQYIDAIRDILNAPNIRDVQDTLPTYVTMMERNAREQNITSSVITGAVNGVNAWSDAVVTTVNGHEQLIISDSENANNIASLKSSALRALDLLESESNSVQTSGKSSNAWSGLGATLGAAVTGAAGGFLVWKATRDIQQSTLSAAEKEAYEEWMDDIGRHIKCYIGTMEAGDYGDIISVGLE